MEAARAVLDLDAPADGRCHASVEIPIVPEHEIGERYACVVVAAAADEVGA